MRETIFLPPWDLEVPALAALVLGALFAVRALRERRLVPLPRQAAGLAFRGAALAALLWIALNPTSVGPREIEGKPHLLVLVDTSASMSTKDSGGESRLAAALKVLQDAPVRSRWESDFVLDVRGFDRDARPLDLGAPSARAATGRATDIGAALSSAVADQADREAQAGILLASDGRATALGADEAARLALARSVPLWTWCLGGPVQRRDLWLEVPSSEVLAFAGAEVELSAALHQTGFEGRTFAVEVSAGGQVLQRVEAAPGPSGEALVQVKVRAPEKGERRYTFRAVEDESEADKGNNERSVFLRVVGEKVRVLVVEGQPHWDTKFLVQSLQRSPHVDLTALYRLGKERSFAVVSAGGAGRREEKDLFPRTLEEFMAYDVLILGRGCEAFFDEKTEGLVTEFASRHGGGIVFSRGKSYEGRFPPLSKLEPVVWGSGVAHGVRLVPDAQETSSPVLELSPTGDLGALLDRLPRFDQILQTVGPKPLATVLASGESPDASAEGGPPVILASQFYGQGRAVTVNASGLWRWAFRKKGKEEDEFVYDRFWSSLLRWLLSGSDFMAGHDVALRSDRRLYTDEQPLRFLIRTRGLDRAAYRPRLAIQGPGVSTEVEPREEAAGIYAAEAGPFPPGSYELRLQNNLGRPERLETTVEVASSSVEERNLSADPEGMARLAKISEGRTLAAGDLPRLGEIVRQWKARKQLADQKESIWDRPWLLGAMLIALAAEWFLRRREGLL